MARRQRHEIVLARIPRGDDQPARGGIAPDLLEYFRHLVDVPAVRRRPRAPLPAVDRAEVAVGIGPFVPDRDAMLVEIFDVGVAAQEPEQLVDDGFECSFLVVTSGNPARQIEAHLMAEDRHACRRRYGRAFPRPRRARVPSDRGIGAWSASRFRVSRGGSLIAK